MAKITKTQKLIDGLIAEGCEEMPCKSGKYRQFKSPRLKEDQFVFVGKSAALRIGKCASKSTSFSSSKWYKDLIGE